MATQSFPPVGDIKLSKTAGTYNTYKMELSFGQLEAIKAALQAKHDDAIADELLVMLDYYSQELPGPGEEKEDTKARDKGVEDAESDFPIPMPPGQETVAGSDPLGKDAEEPDLEDPGLEDPEGEVEPEDEEEEDTEESLATLMQQLRQGDAIQTDSVDDQLPEPQP